MIRRMTDYKVREATAPGLAKLLEDTQAEEDNLYQTIEAKKNLSPIKKAEEL